MQAKDLVATVVLAGGQGTRLYPLTIHHAKPAVSYGGRYRLIDIPISNSINSDFRRIFVIAQYLSAELQHHISQTYHFDSFAPGIVDVLTPQINERGEQEWFNGTADAVRKTLPTLLKSDANYFLILAGDQLYNINFQEMFEFAKKSGAELTIAALPVAEAEAKRMGLIKVDAQNRITNFCEKPQDKDLLEQYKLSSEYLKEWSIDGNKSPHYLGSMGIYIFTREALISLLEADPREDFGKHLICTAVQTNHRASAYVYRGYWEDIGTIASYYKANLILTTPGEGLNTYDENQPIYTRPSFLPGPKIRSTKINQSIICEGSIIDAEEITHSIIGLRSRIKKGTIIRDTVMLGNHFYMPPSHQGKPLHKDYEIGEDCLIEKAIIDEHVFIGNRVQLINREQRMHYDGDGIFIRDGIIIVVSKARIPDGFVL